jgi:hypothetical protein
LTPLYVGSQSALTHNMLYARLCDLDFVIDPAPGW